MKSLRTVLNQVEDYKKPIIADVIRKIGKDAIKDVNNHSIGGGFNGFIYCADTIAFYKKHRAGINQWMEEMADECCESIITMVSGFRCLENQGICDFIEDEIGQAIWGNIDDAEEQIINAFAWFAAEEVCRLFEN
jgi:hypothetical protein